MILNHMRGEKKTKNLLIIVPTLQLGGQERIAAKTADLMSESYNVTLVVFDTAEAVYSTSCKAINVDIPSQSGKTSKVINVLKRVRIVRSIRKKLQPDFVYSFGTTANLVNVLSKGVGRSIIGIRAFQSVVSPGRIDQFVLRHTDSIVCNSEEMCKVVVGKNFSDRQKVRCLYNPIDVSRILEQSKEIVEDYVFSRHTIVSHGRLEEVKNWPRLIKAFSIVKKEVADAQLLIIGEGEQRKKLELLISKYALQESVTLLGYRSNPFKYLARSTVYVLPSYSEGFPNSLVEGMVFLPVISADCKTGPREILTGRKDKIAVDYEVDDFGILVQPALSREYHEELTSDDEALAGAILEVLEKPELARMLKKAACKRATEFSCERYMEELIGILESWQ